MNIFNKVVTVTPRYIFNNLTNFMISVFQTEYSACKYALMEKEKTIIHFRKPTKEKNIQILIESFDVSQIKWRPSGILEVSSPGDLQFICQSQDGKIVRYFNLSIVPQEQYLCLTLEEQESENCLLQIENLTDLFTIGITQSKVNEIIFAVPPKEKKPFAWINPSALNEVMFWLNLGEDDSNPIFCRFDSLDKNYREKVRFKSGNCEEFFVFFNVSIEKGVKVLKISQSSDMNKEQDLSLREWSIDIQLYSLGISLITTKAMRKCELMYFNFTPVRVLIIAHDITFTMQLEVKNLAVDNNLVGDPLYPLVLCAKTITKQSLAPAINFVITTKNRNRHGVKICYLS